MMTLKSSRNQLIGANPQNTLQQFCFFFQARGMYEFGHINLQQDVDQFVLYQAIEGALLGPGKGWINPFNGP